MYSTIEKYIPHNLIMIQTLLSPDNVPNGEMIHSNASGYASLIIRDNKLIIDIYVRGLKNITMAHIHFFNRKDQKTNGPILLWLVKSKVPFSIQNGYLVQKEFSIHDFEKPYSIQDFITMVRKQEFYWNIHTVQNPGGELAGILKITHQFY